MSVIPTSWTTWTTARYVCEVIKDRPTFIQWLISQELIAEKKFCDKGHEMKRICQENKYISSLGYFECLSNHSDGKERIVSCAKDTCFENSRLYPEKIVMIFLLFANNLSHHIACKELSFFGEVSLKDILEWYCYCHEVISEFLYEHRLTEGMLGGKGTVVEIDVLGFGERKRFSRQIKEGMYILGFIEHGSKNFRLELCPDNKHNAKSLLPLIRKYIHPGTTVMCDTWAEFNKAKGYTDFHFRKVNYLGSEDAESGAKVIEPAWRICKRRLLSDGIKEFVMADQFMKFLFHRKVTLNKVEPFEKLLKMISLSYRIRT